MSALAGRHIVITRPRDQSAALMAGVVAAGGRPVLFPLLEIVGVDAAGCEEALNAASKASLAIFISPNAVSFGLPIMLARAAWPTELAIAAVGQGTAKVLGEHGFDQVIVPASDFDSEALLACPALSAAAVAGRTVLLFKGVGGRDLLAATLTERGARVIAAPCYRRLPPTGSLEQLLSWHTTGALDAFVVTSSEAMRHFGELLGERGKALLQTPVFCPHPRIAEAATAIGCLRVRLTAAGDAGLLAGLSEYNWPS